jgi:hypothetical protein
LRREDALPLLEEEDLFDRFGDKSATVISAGDVWFLKPFKVPSSPLLEPAAKGGSTIAGGFMPLIMHRQPTLMLGVLLGAQMPYINQYNKQIDD